MSNPSYTISHSAYLKIILHAAKYPHAQVSGLLLGYFGPGGSNVVVEDAVPLLHHWNALAPITEVGITLAEAYAQTLSPQTATSSSSASRLLIVGYYEAPVQVSERALSSTAARISQRIASRLAGEGSSAAKEKGPGRGALVLLVNNSLLLSPTSGHALIPHFQPSSSTAAVSTTGPAPAPHPIAHAWVQLAEPDIVSKVTVAVRGGKWKQLVDFDDHLEDTSLDWLANPAVALIT